MKTALVFTATLPFLLSSCMVTTDWEAGDGVPVTETRSLSAFSRVELDGPVQVTIKTGSAYAAYVTSDANLISYIETETFGGVLTISQDWAIDPVVEPHITVIVPDLRGLVHNGSGLVVIEEDGEFPDLSLTLNGSGEIRFSGTASHLAANLNGSGRIYAEGYAAWLEANLRGYGEISAENLLAGDADVDLSGSGNIYLDLDYGSILNLALSGSGRVEWWGAPSLLVYDLTGTGKVIEHRGLPKKTAATAASAAAKTAADKLSAAKVAAGKPAAKRGTGAPDQPYEIVKKNP